MTRSPIELLWTAKYNLLPKIHPQILKAHLFSFSLIFMIENGFTCNYVDRELWTKRWDGGEIITKSWSLSGVAMIIRLWWIVGGGGGYCGAAQIAYICRSSMRLGATSFLALQDAPEVIGVTESWATECMFLPKRSTEEGGTRFSPRQTQIRSSLFSFPFRCLDLPPGNRQAIMYFPQRNSNEKYYYYLFN